MNSFSVMSEQKKTDTTKTVRVTTIVVSIFFLVLLAFVGSIGIVYGLPQSSLGKRIRTIAPYPAVLIDYRHSVAFSDLDENLYAVKRSYESQADALSQSGLRVDFSTADGQKRLMIHEKELINKAIEDRVVEMLAKDRGINITPETVHERIDRKIKEVGNQGELEERLRRIYGWSIADFEDKVVRPSLYMEELEKVFVRDVDRSSQAKQKITQANEDLRAGTSFDQVAARYSDGSTAQEGGDLGWVAVNDLVPEIATALKTQSLHRPSNIIESSIGFHIVVLEERKKDKDEGDMVRLKQIFTRKLSFVDWLKEEQKKHSVQVLFRGYHWNPETVRIEFTDPNMEKFEEVSREQWSGDASLVF